MPITAPLYPVNLVVDGRSCLVVGGGRVALAKATELVACGADVVVVAPEITPELLQLDRVIGHTRPYRVDDLAGRFLVVSATGVPAVDGAVAADARAAGVLVNVADVPDLCEFTLPARIRRGDLLVTFSTNGRSPAMSTWLRRRFGPELGPEYGTLLELLSECRAELQSRGVATEGLDWQGALDSGMLDLIREGRLAEAKERLQACLSSSSD